MEELIEMIGRVYGRLPPICEIGAAINASVPDSMCEEDAHTTWAVLEEIVGEYQCLRRASCWTCSKGMALAEDALFQQGLPMPPHMLDELVKPWSDSAPTGAVRQFCTLCEVGAALRMVPDVLLEAGLIETDCLKRQSCAQCPTAVEQMAGALRTLFEEGWDSEVGRMLRGH